MDLLKKYHVVIEDLASGEKEGFMIYSENNLFSIATLQALAPKMSQGESTMGDLTNQYVFIQYNWSGHISVETRGYVGPAGVKYRSPSFNYSQLLPTGAYWYGHGVDTTSQQGEIRLGRIVKELEDSLNINGQIHVVEKVGNTVFVGLKDSPLVYKYEFDGDNRNLSLLHDFSEELGGAKGILSLKYVKTFNSGSSFLLVSVEKDSGGSEVYKYHLSGDKVYFDQSWAIKAGYNTYCRKVDQLQVRTRSNQNLDVSGASLSFSIFTEYSDSYGDRYCFEISGVPESVTSKLIPNDYITFYNASGDIVERKYNTDDATDLSGEVRAVERDKIYMYAEYQNFNGLQNGPCAYIKISDSSLKSRAFIEGSFSEKDLWGGVKYKVYDGDNCIGKIRIRWVGERQSDRCYMLQSTTGDFGLSAKVPTESKYRTILTQLLYSNEINGSNCFNDYYLEIYDDWFDGTDQFPLNSEEKVYTLKYCPVEKIPISYSIGGPIYYVGVSNGTYFPNVYLIGQGGDNIKMVRYDYITVSTSNGSKNVEHSCFTHWDNGSDGYGGRGYSGDTDVLFSNTYCQGGLGYKQNTYINGDENVVFPIKASQTGTNVKLYNINFSWFKDYTVEDGPEIGDITYIYGLSESSGMYIGNAYDEGKLIEMYRNGSSWDIIEYDIPYRDSDGRAKLMGGSFLKGNYYVPDPVNNTLYKFDISYNRFEEVANIDIEGNDVLYPVCFTLGNRLIIESNKNKIFCYDDKSFADKGYLVSSIYGGYLGGINKVRTYGRIRLGKQDTDYGQKIRLAVSTDGGKTFYYLPRILGLPLIEDNFGNVIDSNYEYTFSDLKGEDRNVATFFFPYGFKSTHIAYKVELYRGIAPIDEFYVNMVELYYVPDTATEYDINLNLVLTPAQKLLDGSIEQPRDRHLRKVGFIRSIYKDRKIVRIYYPWGESVYAIPTDLMNSGGFRLSAAEIEKGKKDIREMSYFVNINFKTLPDEIISENTGSGPLSPY